MEIAATVGNLIKNLLPNSEGHRVPSSWISNELSPLLSSMHAKEVATYQLATSNASTNHMFAILLAVIFMMLMVISAVGFMCYKHSDKISAWITDSLHYVFGELGTRPPNRVPTFSI